MRIFWVLLNIIFFGFPGFAQTPFTFEPRDKTLTEGLYFFELSHYGIASEIMNKYIESPIFSGGGQYPKLENEALFQSQIADLYLELPQAPNRLHYTIDKHLPDPVTTTAILELAGYYYNQRAFKSCVETYEKTDLSLLPLSDQVEPRFRKGYCHFVMKEFAEARKEFEPIKKDLGDYYFHVQYYLGLSEYFSGNHDKALAYFNAAEQTPVYKPYIPYYSTQILFSRGKYDELIEYGEEVIKNSQTKNIPQIRLLLGQTYFTRENYKDALPHVEFYASRQQKMTVEEFYLTGFTFYKNMQYKKAIQYFGAINREANIYGQLANYYLADCYLKNEENNEARMAFKKVSQMDFIPSMKDEAAFNYAKLSAASGIEREAINSLLGIVESSRFHEESRDILADVLDRSADVNHVIEVLEKEKKLTSKMKAIYQAKQITAGHKAYLDKNYGQAENHYSKSLQYDESENLQAEALFWKAMAQQYQQAFDRSISTFQSYFQKASTLSLPVGHSPFLASYSQGYNYLKKQDYTKAAEFFQRSSYIFTRDKIASNPWAETASDASARAGDCLLKERDFKTALVQYNKIISNNWNNADYAMLQKGIILGLQNEPYEKILVLKELYGTYKKSSFLDLTLLYTGDTYNDLGSLDNAYMAYQDLLKSFGKSSRYANEARVKSGLIAYNKGDLNTAIKHYKEVLQNNPSPQETQSAVTGLEEIYIQDLGKPDEYIAILEKIPGYKASTYSADSLNYKVGEVRFQNGDYEKAVDAFSVYLSKYPKGYYQVQALYYRAESHAVLKNYTEALRDYESVTATGNIIFLESAYKKAALITYNHTLDFAKSYQYYDLYYTKTTEEAEKSWASSGAMRSAFRNNQPENTIKYANIILQNPATSKDDKAAANYFAGKMYYQQKEYEKSKTYFSAIGDDVNTNQAAEARFWIGDILFKAGKSDEAESHCQKANELNKYFPYWIARTVLIQADIYLERNDLFSARAAIEAVLENFSDDEGLVKLANERKTILEGKEKNQSKIKPKNQEQLLLDNRSQN